MSDTKLQSKYDLCVIGGGINGAGIARDAAGRGMSVLLVEARDLAGATSSASTKLIHGGLRYLEYLEFHLVRESLKERERLMNMAPHIIEPMRFILPHDKAQRPGWLIRLGLFFYDNLTRRKKIPASKGVRFKKSEFGAPLNEGFKKGFQYFDCWVDDSRLVVLNAMSAAEKGADVLTYTPATAIKEGGEFWRITLEPEGGKKREVLARKLVNAAGPWVKDILDEAGLSTPETPRIRLVKGSHIIIKRAYEGRHSYILQQPDKRIVFVIPYEDEYTLIGTTEENFDGDPYEVRISDEETQYLCDAYNRAFKSQITKQDMLWTYSGVRPLFDDGGDNATAVTRDYRIFEQRGTVPPLLSVFGGKLTTYRVLAEQVVNRFQTIEARPATPWSGTENLPGGGMDDADFEKFFSWANDKYTWLDERLVRRYAESYGTRMERLLDKRKSLADMGLHYGGGLYEAEVEYLVKYEWARTAEDVLWRRTKLGLHVNDKTVQTLEKALPKLLKQYG